MSVVVPSGWLPSWFQTYMFSSPSMRRFAESVLVQASTPLATKYTV